ncbi:hypothetical protein [Parafrankia discariae]|uniref:hypothetical protein n=1 Tax=Parafrankia discariae TaxID=365528 RepID=UPI000372754C|nr:hypothetical protein [Parafrankia discariae]
MTDEPTWLAAIRPLLAGSHTPTGDVLDAGAELVVSDDPDGPPVFTAPLARMLRHDPAHPDVVWIRPVVGGYPVTRRGPGQPSYLFSLSVTRRRSLHVTHAQVLPTDDTGAAANKVVLQLANGQTAVIRPASGATLEELERWDTFALLVLDREDLVALEELREDSWHGAYA